MYTTKLLLTCLEKISSRLIPRIVLIFEMEGFNASKYRIDEAKLEEYEINDPWVHQFTNSIGSLIQPYKEGLTENNYSYFVQCVLNYICKELETKLLNKKFTLFGAVQLDRELKVLMDFFNKDTKKSVRNKFSRLTQISSLLNLAQVNDVLDIWGEKASIDMKWKLTTDEVKFVLGLREDFSGSDINNLVKIKIEIISVT